MNELYVRFYEVSNDVQLEDCWINDVGDPDEVQTLLDEFDIDFYDDVLEPIQTQVGTQSISQIDVVYYFPYWLDIDGDHYDAFVDGLTLGRWVSDSVELGFVSEVCNGDLTTMISKVLEINTSGWSDDEIMEREESEVLEFVNFLTKCRVRGNSVIGFGNK